MKDEEALPKGERGPVSYLSFISSLGLYDNYRQTLSSPLSKAVAIRGKWSRGAIYRNILFLVVVYILVLSTYHQEG